MEITFDQAKNERNITDRGLAFTMVQELDWSSATISEDLRKNYGERRYIAIGLIEERVYVVIFTPREGRFHVISLRKANKREVKRYEQES